MTKNKLIIGRAIFTMFVVISFGLIIMNEKGAELFIPKIKDKINEYIESNYSNIKDIKIDEIKYNDKKFKAKVSSNNKYFYITYYKGNITDTYNEDYIEGKELLNNKQKELQKIIENKTNIKCNPIFINSLNNYSNKVQEKILNEDISNLKVYYIEKELTVDNFNKEEITKTIINFINKLYTKEITPKYYKITIIDNNDILNTVEINNLNETFTTNNNNLLIINDIINNDNSQLLKNEKITYKYLN